MNNLNISPSELCDAFEAEQMLADAQLQVGVSPEFEADEAETFSNRKGMRGRSNREVIVKTCI